MVNRWEHKAEMFPARLEDAEAVLKELGEQGWQMVQVCPPNSKGECLVWLKREIEK